MKLRESQASTVHRVGIESGSRRAFGMRAGKKAFKILSSTIYKYKIRAIIREISCNAIDGHIVAGNMDRFDVQLPTVLDPRFIVRDYGTGLSDYIGERSIHRLFRINQNRHRRPDRGAGAG